WWRWRPPARTAARWPATTTTCHGPPWWRSAPAQPGSCSAARPLKTCSPWTRDERAGRGDPPRATGARRRPERGTTNEERARSDEGRRRLTSAPEASGGQAEGGAARLRRGRLGGVPAARPAGGRPGGADRRPARGGRGGRAPAGPAPRRRG